MIEQYLSQINESATVPTTFHFSELNKTQYNIEVIYLKADQISSLSCAHLPQLPLNERVMFLE